MPKKRKKKSKDIKIFSKSLDSLEACLLSIKKNPRFKEGMDYINSFLEEIDNSRAKLEDRVEEYLEEEKKRLTHHFIHLEKFLNRINK
jgi:hypothetical protein